MLKAKRDRSHEYSESMSSDWLCVFLRQGLYESVYSVNKFFVVFRLRQKSFISVYCIVFILFPCFLNSAFPVERSPVHNTIVQNHNIFKALVPCFRLGVCHVGIERVGSSFKVVFQKFQSVKKLSARGSILTIPVNIERSKGTKNCTDNCRDKASKSHFPILSALIGAVIGVIIFWEIIVPIFY